MKNFDTRLAAHAARAQDFPEPKQPEIVLTGRSNVGKSSFLNSLCGQKNLARVSKTPGRTREVFFYECTLGFTLVDLPGYGFAKAGRGEKESWKALIESYFGDDRKILLVISLLDARHPATLEDSQLHAWFRSQGIPWEPLATKIDKLGANDRRKAMEALRLQLGISYAPMFYSSQTGEGRDRVLAHLKACVAGYQGNPK